jgi:hypothetical protein
VYGDYQNVGQFYLVLYFYEVSLTQVYGLGWFNGFLKKQTALVCS